MVCQEMDQKKGRERRPIVWFSTLSMALNSAIKIQRY